VYIAYTFLIIYEKIHQFLLSVKRDAHEKIVSFFSDSPCTAHCAFKIV